MPPRTLCDHGPSHTRCHRASSLPTPSSLPAQMLSSGATENVSVPLTGLWHHLRQGLAKHSYSIFVKCMIICLTLLIPKLKPMCLLSTMVSVSRSSTYCSFYVGHCDKHLTYIIRHVQVPQLVHTTVGLVSLLSHYFPNLS